MTDNRFGRRPLLAAAAAIASAGIVGCSGQSGQNSATQNIKNAKVKLPTYVPYHGVTTDFPALTSGVMAGYTSYPESPIKAYDGVPGKGGTVTAMTDIYMPIPPGVGSNRYWQELNKRLGVDLKMNMIPDDTWADKFGTVVAGGGLPDIVQVVPTQPERAELLKAEFADLTEYVTGDAVKKYRFLANIPTISWASNVFNGSIYGIPIPRAVVGSYVYKRDDIIEAKGVNGTPKSFADFKELCLGLVDKKRNHYALGTAIALVNFTRSALGVPTGWIVKNGKFTNAYETSEMKQALSSIRELVQAGVFHPDTFTATTVQNKTWFTGGITALGFDSYNAWTAYATDPGAVKQGAKVGAIIPFGYSGEQIKIGSSSGNFSTVAFKKAPKERIEELLEIANWLAIPYGTEEYLFRKYGIKGADYTMKDGNPVLTNQGTRETAVTTYYITDSPQVIGPGPKELIKAQYDYQTKIAPLLVADPTVGLYSQTDSQTGYKLGLQITNFINDYLQGRKPLSGWADVVKTWRSTGGDKIRQEYEQAYHAVH